jgi:hypothetical protein
MSTPEWPSAVERSQIERALHDADVTLLTLKVHTGSPWLQVDVWVHLEGPRQLALWRATGAVHAVGSDGAVEEDPIIPAGWNMETL